LNLLSIQETNLIFKKCWCLPMKTQFLTKFEFSTKISGYQLVKLGPLSEMNNSFSEKHIQFF